MTLGQNTPGRDLKERYLYVGAAMLLGLLVLAVNLYRLQIVHGDEYFAKSEDNRIKEIRVRAQRGLIKDVRGRILVDERPSYDLFITPAFCQACATEVLPRLATFLSWSDEQLARVEAQVKSAHGPSRFQPMAVQVDLSRDELDRVLAHKSELAGVEPVVVPHRNYHSELLPGVSPMVEGHGAPRAVERQFGLAHVLGYMNEVTAQDLERLNATSDPTRPRYALGDFIGRRGIERYFELREISGRDCANSPCGLRGIDGWRKEVVNARGQTIRKVPGLIEPKRGNDIILSIDARLQAEAEAAFPGTAGAVIVIDVNTGFILAMVSRPAFDPNVLTGRITPAELAAISRDRLQPMVFRPTAQHYSPGSTFKPITMLAAFASGLFQPGSVVSCPGGYRLGSRTWRCHKAGGHGPVDAREAMQKSCDTWFYKVADTIGIDAIAEVGRAFGLGSPTNIGVVAEVPGIMPDSHYHDRVSPGGYTKGMALNSAIGQGDDNVTPLQLVLAYAAIANGGTLHRPQLVKEIRADDGTVLERFAPVVVRRTNIPKAHRDVILDSLIATVNEPGGTAYRSRLPDLVYAGKTGTAQVARLGQVRLKKEQMEYFLRDHAWFGAFAPAVNPEIAVVVLNEHGGHGGSDAAPTAAAVIRKYFELKRLDEQGAEAPSATTPPRPQSPATGEPAVTPAPPRPSIPSAPRPRGTDRELATPDPVRVSAERSLAEAERPARAPAARRR